jgi:uncharacterized protein YeaO (DUF488 family)
MSRRIPAHHIRLRRAYEPVAGDDGTRILVDRLWPRGVSKSFAHYDLWWRDVAPSSRLRKWFAHRPERWAEFRRRYRRELLDHAHDLRELRRRAREGPITLVYGASDTIHNHAVVLRRVLLGRANPEEESDVRRTLP